MEIEKVNILTAIILATIVGGHFLFLFIREGKGMITGLKGENKIWDGPEITLALGLSAFVLAFFSALVVPIIIPSYAVPTWIIGSINLVLITGLSARAISDKELNENKDA